MPLHSYFVLTEFTVLLMSFLMLVMRLRNYGSDIMGTPTIERLYFYSGKIAIFSTWGLFMVKAIYPSVGYVYLPAGFSWVAVGLLTMGVLIMSAAFINLGKSLTVGLPTQETTLRTHGVYRFSRNPLYVGVHLIAVGSCLYFPDLLNIAFTLYGMVIHHRIIKQEEHFLSDRFGTDWLIYSARVSRYI